LRGSGRKRALTLRLILDQNVPWNVVRGLEVNGCFTGLGRVRRAVDLPVSQVNDIRLVVLEVQVAIADEAFEALLVVAEAHDLAHQLQWVDLLDASGTRVRVQGHRMNHRDMLAGCYFFEVTC